jgi:hypothetical protein
VSVRTGRYNNRVTWSAGPVVLPLGCGLFGICLGCDEGISAGQPAGAARLSHAGGTLLGKRFSDEVGRDTPFYPALGLHMLAEVLFVCAAA